MTDKITITIKRDILEHTVVALEYAYNAEDEMVMESIRFLRHALAAQPAEPVAWINRRVIYDPATDSVTEYGEPELSFERASYGYDYANAKPLILAQQPAEAQPAPAQEPWKCVCGANLYIDENGKPMSKASQQEQKPVAWRHSKTGQLYDLEEEVPLADGDEWAEPLYAAPVAQQEPSAWRQWSTKRHDWDYQTNKGDLRPDAPVDPLFVAAAQPEAIEQALQKIADFGQDQEPVAWIGLPGKGTPLYAAQPAPEPCCGEYATCQRTCFPRGKWLGRREAESEIECLTADLLSCRGTVKTELAHYERLALVHGKTVLAANYEAEAQRLSDLLDRIDAIATPTAPTPHTKEPT